MRKRTNRVEFKLNDTEYKHLNELVKTSNLSRESYLRMLINGLVPRPAPSTELIEVIQVLRQISESLYSMAQNHIDESTYANHYEELQNQINEIMILIRQPTNLEELWQSQKYGQSKMI